MPPILHIRRPLLRHLCANTIKLFRLLNYSFINLRYIIYLNLFYTYFICVYFVITFIYYNPIVSYDCSPFTSSCFHIQIKAKNLLMVPTKTYITYDATRRSKQHQHQPIPSTGQTRVEWSLKLLERGLLSHRRHFTTTLTNASDGVIGHRSKAYVEVVDKKDGWKQIR